MEIKEGACSVVEKPKRFATGLVRPCPELKLLLEKVGATAPVYTKFEVIEHLKEYISDQKLCDPNNPTKIKCENDILEKVFGCKEFLTENVCELLHHKLESVSDTSDAELGLISFESNKQQDKKRKRANLTDVSSSYSSGTGSPLNIPYYSLGFIRKSVFESRECESNDDYSDGSRRSSYSRKPGYETAATAVVSDSEDEINFVNDDMDTFSIEYEPPEMSDDDDDDDNDEEPAIVISSDEEEDPGADGGDEYDIDEHSDSEDAWECSDCWSMNHPMTTKCVMCWKERSFVVQQFTRAISAPVIRTSANINFLYPLVPCLPRCKTDLPFVKIENSQSNTTIDKGACVSTSLTCAAEAVSLLDKNIQVSLSRSSSSCSSTTQTSCDSGICVSSCETDTEKTTSVDTKKYMHDRLDCQEKLDSNVICFGDKRVDSTSLPSAFSSYSAKAMPESSATSIPSDSSQETVLLESTSEKKAGETLLCVICAVEPRNASIIHGRSGHQVCCITCAEKLKAARKKCPVCRRKIRHVIKNFL